ncbi:MAG: hypothetical protein LAT64_06620 [Phycisphaerales bacterium]|nr:hypothetical protein [Planctomycetota bacterium]MCH8508428.1 hypothetical protein [Phycisphaerales bacterium]
MHLVISPYSLCARDAAAMAGLLLADPALTFLPRSLETAPVSRERAIGSPGFRRVMESVAWTTPLLGAGVLATSVEGQDASEAFASARRRVYEDPGYTALRRFVGPRRAFDESEELERLASDLTRSGPDPSISVPLAGALDSFAARHGYAVVRVDGPSLAQKAERARERRLFACSVPVLVQAGPERLLETRRRLERELNGLRRACEDALDGLADEGAVREAAAAYSQAYDDHRHHIERAEDDPDDPMVRSAEAVLIGVAHERDHAMSSSLAAARRVTRGSGRTDESAGTLAARSLIVRLVGR